MGMPDEHEYPVAYPAPPAECDTAEGRVVVQAKPDSVVVGAGADVMGSPTHRFLIR